MIERPSPHAHDVRPLEMEDQYILFRDSDGRQHVVNLSSAQTQLTIGRSSSNDVTLAWDDQLSRLHAQLERVSTHWVLVDNASRNGTFVNGERLSGRRLLHDGDTVLVGSTSLTFKASRVTVSRPTRIAETFAAPPSLSETQRLLLNALCRPHKVGGPYAAPASNQQIANELFLSVDAVKTHLRTLFQKFRLEDLPQNQKRAKLVERAFQLGLVSEQDR
jgi:hypothetical protein